MADIDKGLDVRALVGLVLLGVATLFQLIGMLTNHWVDTASDTYGSIGSTGLFQKCSSLGQSSSTCEGFFWQNVQVSHWFRTVQALSVIGWIIGTVALAMMLLHHFVATCYTNRKLKIFSVVQCILAFCMIVSACIVVWCLNDTLRDTKLPGAETYMSWSFGFSITSSVFYLASGIVILIT